jgi:hypothetical protein
MLGQNIPKTGTIPNNTSIPTINLIRILEKKSISGIFWLDPRNPGVFLLNSPYPPCEAPLLILNPNLADPLKNPPNLANRRRDFVHGLSGTDTKFSLGQSQLCPMTSRPIKRGLQREVSR